MQLGLLVWIHNETSARGGDAGKMDRTRPDDGEETVLCCPFSLCHFRLLKLRYGYIGFGGVINKLSIASTISANRKKVMTSLHNV